MTILFHFFILLPLAGFIISLLIPGKKEKLLARVISGVVGLHLFSFLVFTVYWLFSGHKTLNVKDIVLLQSDGYEFFIDFCFDKITAVYLFVGSLLTFLVSIYSSYYLHRESGYKRFFNSIMFFFLGYNIAVCSGNLETLFIGWEILGISSFLLIAFYRERYLPVKNALKVFSIYRIGDVGLLLAMWMIHHLFHENMTFVNLNNETLVSRHLESHTLIGALIAVMLLISAAAKSGQLPFSSWVPRAMEGPTPSSAIFYGSLSVHLGVFILLRTYEFWEYQYSVRILIGLLGLFTSIVTSGIARVQSSVKSQIAYASVSQIGLIFIEVALGWEDLALVHFAGNAFLRTYQLLVSPSVVSYLIREQFYDFNPRQRSVEDRLPSKLENTFYMICLKEFNLDSFMYRVLWSPMKWVGNKLGFLNVKRLLLFVIPIYLVGLFCLYNPEMVPVKLPDYLPIIFALIGLVMVLKSFTERKNVWLAWLLVILNHFWIALAVSFNEHFSFGDVHIYLSGIVVSGFLGFLCLRKVKDLELVVDLNQFHGYSWNHKTLALMFLLCCLGLAGFPITPTFIAEDLIFSHIREDQVLLAFFISLSVIIDGLAIIRIYARVFLGPHAKSPHEMAYRSS